MFQNFRGASPTPKFNLTSETVEYLAVRVEGNSTTNTSPGSSNSIYEIYFFVDGWVELRIGNWTSKSGISGYYQSDGIGGSFTAPASGNSYVFTNHLGQVSQGITKNNHVYENGMIVAKSNASDRYPLLGAGPTASANWPPSGWTSLVNYSIDDGNVDLSGARTYVRSLDGASGYMPYFGGYIYLSDVYICSNGWISFNASSAIYSGISTSNPAINKIMIDAADRSYQQVAWKVGSK